MINKNWTNPDGTHAGGTFSDTGVTIAWQRGPISKEGDQNGALLLTVLGACKDQLEYFQDSKFACEENQEALDHLSACMGVLERRRDRRKAEGTLGKAEGTLGTTKV